MLEKGKERDRERETERHREIERDTKSEIFRQRFNLFNFRFSCLIASLREHYKHNADQNKNNKKEKE